MMTHDVASERQRSCDGLAHYLAAITAADAIDCRPQIVVANGVLHPIADAAEDSHQLSALALYDYSNSCDPRGLSSHPFTVSSGLPYFALALPNRHFVAS
jgi:hypothetical protein